MGWEDKNGKTAAPMLFPYEPDIFLEQIRQVIREEMGIMEKEKKDATAALPSEFTYKPLYRSKEVCSLFHISKPTLYDWIKKGKLKPLKVSSRVYFLLKDIQELLQRQQ
jgi:excisionase family DNA binding protein